MKLCSKWMDQPSSTKMRQGSQCPSLRIKSWSASRPRKTVLHKSRQSDLPSSRTLGIKSPWIRPCSVITPVGTTIHKHCTQSVRSRISLGSINQGLLISPQCLKSKTLKYFKMPSCKQQSKTKIKPANMQPMSHCHRLVRKKKMKSSSQRSFPKP